MSSAGSCGAQVLFVDELEPDWERLVRTGYLLESFAYGVVGLKVSNWLSLDKILPCGTDAYYACGVHSPG